MICLFGGNVASMARVAHGRTRMIVFPLIPGRSFTISSVKHRSITSLQLDPFRRASASGQGEPSPPTRRYGRSPSTTGHDRCTGVDFSVVKRSCGRHREQGLAHEPDDGRPQRLPPLALRVSADPLADGQLHRIFFRRFHRPVGRFCKKLQRMTGQSLRVAIEHLTMDGRSKKLDNGWSIAARNGGGDD
jgi:hypothetical protein